MKNKYKSNIPEFQERQSKIAANLCEVHGQGHITQGRSGSVLYIACPRCLEVYGRRELSSRHLAVVLDKALGGSRYPCAYCMKHQEHAFTLPDLFSFPPITKRIPGYQAQRILESPVETRYPLLKHESGLEVPYPPGTCIPITELPPDHVAVRYLVSRKYNLSKLRRQFAVEFCTCETPPTETNGLFYRKWEQDFRDTPQHRIIFHALVNGVSRGWQGRLIDAWDGNTYLIYHPYTGLWTPVGERVLGELQYYPQYTGTRRTLSKYRNALGFLSGNSLFGYDSFLERNKHVPFDKRVVVLTEGPLDAARFPSNGVAYTRAHVSPAQARMAGTMAATAVLAHDNDEAALKCVERNTSLLQEYVPQVITLSPAPFKDFGEAGYKTASKLLNAILQ